MANDIVWFDSSEVGGPTLNNAAGSLDGVLNACLVTGFRPITLASITVAGGVATASFPGGHGYSNLRMVDIAGATDGAINGRKRITVTGAPTFTFPAPGVADGPVGGTITAKRSPLGWARPLSSGNVSIYTRTDVTATPMALRVDDSGSGAAGATHARWRMVESFSDLSTFTGAAPVAALFGDAGVYIPKGANSAGAKPWVLVGDSRTFYLFTDSSDYPASSWNGVGMGPWAFGDIGSFRPGDGYACLLAGGIQPGGLNGDSFGTVRGAGGSGFFEQVVLSRAFNGIGSAVTACMRGLADGSRRMGSGGPTYPSPVDNGLLILSPVLLAEQNAAFSYPVRGQVRGVGDPFASIAGGLLHLQVLSNLAGSDRDWLMVGFQQAGSYGHMAFDITGPW